MPLTPASIIADALSSLTKAANLAVSIPSRIFSRLFAYSYPQLATVEEQAKSDIAQARRERDEAVKALHDIQLQEKEWQRRVDGWQVSVSFITLVVGIEA